MAQPTSHCWEKRSAITSSGQSTGSESVRRWWPAIRVTEQPTASSGTRRAWPRAGCSRVAFVGETESESGAPNRFEWVVVQYAAARIGAILVNINPAYKASELEFVLNHSGTSLLL